MSSTSLEAELESTGNALHPHAENVPDSVYEQPITPKTPTDDTFQPIGPPETGAQNHDDDSLGLGADSSVSSEDNLGGNTLSEGGKKGPSTRQVRMPTSTNVKMAARIVNFEDYKNRFTNDDGLYLIEAHYLGSDLVEEIQQETLQRIEYEKSKKSEEQQPKQASPAKDRAKSQQKLERIRINSHIVWYFIFKEQVINFGIRDAHQVKYPFSVLDHVHDKMRQYLKELEDRHHASSTDNLPKAGNLQVPAVEIGDIYSLESAGWKDEEFETHHGLLPEEHEYRESDSRMSELHNSDLDKLSTTKAALRHMRAYVRFFDEFIIPLRKMFDGVPDIHDMSIQPSLDSGKAVDKPLTKARFQDLWYLFKPGDLVFSPNIESANIAAQGSKNQYIWRVEKVIMPKIQADYHLVEDINENPRPKVLSPEERADPKNGFQVETYFIHYDGVSFGPVRRNFVIHPYDGEINIRQLPCFPVRFYPDYEIHLEKLKRRGEKFQKCIRERNVNANGWTLTCSPIGTPLASSESSSGLAREYVDSQIVVDFAEACGTNLSWTPEFLTHHQDSGVNLQDSYEALDVQWWLNRQRENRLESVVDHNIDIQSYSSNGRAFTRAFFRWLRERSTGFMNVEVPDQLVNLTEPEDLVLLPRSLYGYVLRERRFAVLDIDTITLVEMKHDALSKLVLEKGYDTMVESLVDVHFMNRSLTTSSEPDIQSQDIIQGKGNGLVILLHGPPGVGKTATAEAIAMKHDKALFAITCGDLGLSPSQVEDSLRSIFRLANLWECILLLDEADIFLSRRGADSSLERNALVSVFLRMLEYYDGVLFLTTNRVGTIDPAFKSRIHLSLFYPELSESQVQRIFRNNLNRLIEIEKSRAQLTGETPMEINLDNIMDDIYPILHEKDSQNSIKIQWNGRLVRNIVQMAASLARHDAKKEGKAQVSLDMKYFVTVIGLIHKFDEYIAQANHDDDATLAANAHERAPIQRPRNQQKGRPTAHRPAESGFSSTNSNVLNATNNFIYEGGNAVIPQQHALLGQQQMPQPNYPANGLTGAINPGGLQSQPFIPSAMGYNGGGYSFQGAPQNMNGGGYLQPQGNFNAVQPGIPAGYGFANQSNQGANVSSVQQNYQLLQQQQQQQQNYPPQQQRQQQPNQFQTQIQQQSNQLQQPQPQPTSINAPDVPMNTTANSCVMGQSSPAVFTGQNTYNPQASQGHPMNLGQAGQNGT